MLFFAHLKLTETKTVRARLDMLEKGIQSSEADVETIKASPQFRHWEKFCKDWNSVHCRDTVEMTEEEGNLLFVEKIEKQIDDCKESMRVLNERYLKELEKASTPATQDLFRANAFLSLSLYEDDLGKKIISAEQSISYIMAAYHITRPAILKTGTHAEPAPLSGITARAIQC